MKYVRKRVYAATGLLALAAVFFMIELKAQVFTPFFTGNNPPLVSPRPAVITAIVINGQEVTDVLDSFLTQTGDVWYEWEPVGN